MNKVLHAIMNFRIADKSDIDALFELNELFNGIGCTTKEQLSESIQNNKQEAVFVASAGDIAVGFCCVQLFKSMCYYLNYAEITELFIKEEYRKKGVATALMTHVEEYFKGQNICCCQLFTGAHNNIAQTFYEKIGYKRSNELMYRKRI